jgi:uncharacterized protein
MRNPFVHVELVSTDVAKAKSFYGKLFPVPDGHSMWIAYVKVGDVKAATRKAKSLGAKVKKDVTKVKGAGSLSIITDPTGAILGLWEPKRKKKKS